MGKENLSLNVSKIKSVDFYPIYIWCFYLVNQQFMKFLAALYQHFCKKNKIKCKKKEDKNDGDEIQT